MKLEIYHPPKKIKVSKEDAIPFILRLGGYFLTLGGLISFVLSGLVMGIKSFFYVKQKVQDNFFHKKYIEIGVRRDN